MLDPFKSALIEIFTSRLFLILKILACIILAEYSGNLSNFFSSVLFMTLFLKKMKILSASKLHFHSRLLNPILKILPIYRKRNFRSNIKVGRYCLNHKQ